MDGKIRDLLARDVEMDIPNPKVRLRIRQAIAATIAFALAAGTSYGLYAIQKEEMLLLGPICLLICSVLGGEKWYVGPTFETAFDHYAVIQVFILFALYLTLLLPLARIPRTRTRRTSVLIMGLILAYLVLCVFPPAALLFVG